jgi:hypothetical protein
VRPISIARGSLIRVSLFLALVVCLCTWVWSANHTAGLFYGRTNHLYFCTTGSGVLTVGHMGPMGGLSSFKGLSLYTNKDSNQSFWPKRTPDSFCGFERDSIARAIAISVPYWFFTLIISFLLAIACRRTRLRISLSDGFPVQTKEQRG